MKRYPSAVKLVNAFLSGEITEPSQALNHTVTADQDHIWNGDKLHLLVVRNRKLNLWVVQNNHRASLGSGAVTAVNSTINIKPSVLVDNVLPELESCDLATLRPHVEQCAIRRMETYLVKLPGILKDPAYNRDVWLQGVYDQAEADLNRVGLPVPERITLKRTKIVAKHRLLAA